MKDTVRSAFVIVIIVIAALALLCGLLLDVFWDRVQVARRVSGLRCVGWLTSVIVASLPARQ